MNEAKQALAWAIGVANDDSHGYSQQDRWGPDYDCSSLVISAYDEAGVPVKQAGAVYTGNMRSAFLRCGFRDVTKACNLVNGRGMEPGDVLLNDAAHAALYAGDGRVVHARSSEGNKRQGDQSGSEIRVQAYWNYPWNAVLRYEGGAASLPPQAAEVKPEPTKRESCAVTLPVLRKGCRGEAVRVMQRILMDKGFSCGSWGADGDFGGATQAALTGFQRGRRLAADGVAGAKTWEALIAG